MKRKKLGEILQESGKISAAELHQLFEEQKGKIVRLGELILERDLVDKPSLVKALEEISHVPYLDCTSLRCDASVLQLIPKAMAVRLDIVPVGMDQSRLIIVMAEPQNVATIDELRFTCGKDISPRFGFRAEILSAIVLNYDHIESAASPKQAADEVVLQTGMEMEFISTSSRQANRDAIMEMQAVVNQKKHPQFVWFRKSFTRRWKNRPVTFTLNHKPQQPWCVFAWMEFCASWKAFHGMFKTRWCPESRLFPTWTLRNAAPHRTDVSW
jgi:hypothetical protein